MLKHIIVQIDNPIIIEIGVFKGTFAKFLQTFSPCKLILIDPWVEGEILYSGDQDGNNIKIYKAEELYREVSEYFLEYKNVIVYKDFSYNVLNNLEENSVDLIYIDGDHSYEGCKKDLILSYSIVKNGGWICGHDYEMNMQKAEKELFFGVKQAVTEFCQEYNQQIIYKGIDGCVSYAIKLNKF
jgi:hypothetical protein